MKIWYYWYFRLINRRQYIFLPCSSSHSHWTEQMQEEEKNFIWFFINFCTFLVENMQFYFKKNELEVPCQWLSNGLNFLIFRILAKNKVLLVSCRCREKTHMSHLSLNYIQNAFWQIPICIVIEYMLQVRDEAKIYSLNGLHRVISQTWWQIEHFCDFWAPCIFYCTFFFHSRAKIIAQGNNNISFGLPKYGHVKISKSAKNSLWAEI